MCIITGYWLCATYRNASVQYKLRVVFGLLLTVKYSCVSMNGKELCFICSKKYCWHCYALQFKAQRKVQKLCLCSDRLKNGGLEGELESQQNVLRNNPVVLVCTVDKYCVVSCLRKANIFPVWIRKKMPVTHSARDLSEKRKKNDAMGWRY
jgi:hypothetical protein